jgi:hypothetical protein
VHLRRVQRCVAHSANQEEVCMVLRVQRVHCLNDALGEQAFAGSQWAISVGGPGYHHLPAQWQRIPGRHVNISDTCSARFPYPCDK